MARKAAKGEETPVVEASEEGTTDDIPEFGKDENQMAELLSEEADDLDAGVIEEVAEVAEVAEVVEAKPTEEVPEVKATELPASTDEVAEQTAEAEPSPAAEVKPEIVEPKLEGAEQAVPETSPEAPPVVKELTDVELGERYGKWRGETEDILAEKYALTDEMAEELEVDAGKAIPRLMAKVYVDAVSATVGHIVANMPQLLETALAGRERNSTAETEFFEVWPQLVGSEHSEILSRFGVSYRTLHPDATKEQFIRDVGAQAMVALRIPVEAKAPVAEAEAAVAPFVPAAASAPAGLKRTPANPFTALSDSFDDEELDLDI